MWCNDMLKDSFNLCFQKIFFSKLVIQKLQIHFGPCIALPLARLWGDRWVQPNMYIHMSEKVLTPKLVGITYVSKIFLFLDRGGYFYT